MHAHARTHKCAHTYTHTQQDTYRYTQAHMSARTSPHVNRKTPTYLPTYLPTCSRPTSKQNNKQRIHIDTHRRVHISFLHLTCSSGPAQIHSIAVHPSRPDLCVSGGSGGLVALWDLRFASAPAAVDVSASGADVWEVCVLEGFVVNLLASSTTTAAVNVFCLGCRHA